jgi:hypothetical protein
LHRLQVQLFLLELAQADWLAVFWKTTCARRFHQRLLPRGQWTVTRVSSTGLGICLSLCGSTCAPKRHRCAGRTRFLSADDLSKRTALLPPHPVKCRSIALERASNRFDLERCQWQNGSKRKILFSRASSRALSRLDLTRAGALHRDLAQRIRRRACTSENSERSSRARVFAKNRYRRASMRAVSLQDRQRRAPWRGASPCSTSVYLSAHPKPLMLALLK